MLNLLHESQKLLGSRITVIKQKQHFRTAEMPTSIIRLMKVAENLLSVLHADKLAFKFISTESVKIPFTTLYLN